MACVWAHGPDVHLDARAYQIDARDPAAGGTPGPARRKVMMVDDDPEVLAAMSDLLRAEGYEVTAFTRAAEALAASPESFDAVILDLRMPAMSGEEFKRALDARGLVVPVILMSSDENVGELASSLGCFDYVHKSSDFEAVHSVVGRAVAEKDTLSGPRAVAVSEGSEDR